MNAPFTDEQLHDWAGPIEGGWDIHPLFSERRALARALILERRQSDNFRLVLEQGLVMANEVGPFPDYDKRDAFRNAAEEALKSKTAP